VDRDAGTLEPLLRRVPFFRTLDRVEIARLIGALERVRVPAGTVIFREGADADCLYLLERGKVQVTVMTPGGERRVAELEGPAHFGDQGLLLERRTGSVRATADVDAWMLPRHRFEQLVREKPAIGIAVAASLAEVLERTSRQHVGAPLVPGTSHPVQVDVPAVSRSQAWRAVGVAAALGLPVALWHATPPPGLDPAGWRILAVMIGAAVAWLFEPVPDFVVTLAMAAAWGLTGLVPLGEAFAGFATSTWLVALGAMGLAAGMVRSGLPFRLALFLLRTFPPTHVGQVMALLAGGFVVTPLVPVGMARVATITPLTQELSDGLGYPRGSRAGAALVFAGFIGYGAFGMVFLTGMAVNFFLLDLLPAGDQLRFGWIGWLLAALPVGVVMLAGAAAVLLSAFRPEVAPRVRADLLRQQRHTLGALSRREKVTIAGLVVLIGGLLFQPVLRVDPGWLAVATLVVVLAGGALSREAFRGSIEWGLLMLFGVLLGTAGVLDRAGVDEWLAGLLVPAAQAVASPAALVLVLAGFVVAVRLVLPWAPAVLLLTLALVPAAPQVGLHPWVVGFVIFVAAGTWLHPNQSDAFRLLRAATRGEMFDQRQALLIGGAITILALGGIAASLPFWSAAGLLSR
jgi:DASS family divalent anion:Na+ symporter